MTCFIMQFLRKSVPEYANGARTFFSAMHRTIFKNIYTKQSKKKKNIFLDKLNQATLKLITDYECFFET